MTADHGAGGPTDGALYTKEWYDLCSDGSLAAARLYAAHLAHFFRPKSVLDVGCGRGYWLKAWQELGSETLVGWEGSWIDASQMIDPGIQLKVVDLNQRLEVDRKFDLAMSLEVAEHLAVESAELFVSGLASSSDLVLFSAAYPNQGGRNHFNEQPPSYWAALFKQHGFFPFDIFRPVFWGDKRASFWYRQNAFLYARASSTAYEHLLAKGAAPLANTAFMNCVHPDLFALKIDDIRQLNEKLIKA